jgi:LysR family glycine cleavage system transcriptional activator/LysR family transcriptional regulator of beta-lactamase
MATGGATRPVRDDWTCTIRRATGAWPGYIAETLFPSTLLPVCTPTLAAKLQRLTDFRDATLLVVSHLRHEWPCWFKAAGVETPVRCSGEIVFESNPMAMQAVLDGVGVAIAQLVYVSDALQTGRLVAPFPIAAQTSETWFLQYRPVRQEDPALRAFRSWLQEEAERQCHVEANLLKHSAGKQAGMV